MNAHATGISLPYYHVRRLISGRYAVAHRVPGADVAHVDAEAASLPAAMRLCAEMEAQHRAGPYGYAPTNFQPKPTSTSTANPSVWPFQLPHDDERIPSGFGFPITPGA